MHHIRVNRRLTNVSTAGRETSRAPAYILRSVHLDLNHLFHRHQAALMGADAASSPAVRREFASAVAGLRSTIRERQHALGATFPLAAAAR